MSKNVQTARKPVGMTTKAMTTCALLAALGVVLARLIVPMPNEFTRFSIEAVPTVLAGILFGPVAGALVGFVADFVGCLFSPYAYNPLFCVPPILYGLCGGLLAYNRVAELGTKLQITAIFLVLNAVILFLPTLLPTGNKDARSMSPLDAMLIGLSGVLGAVPGFSRDI